MKRKFFSTLLFGALACATLGTVTSCKDYDDDINNLQTEQASLLSQIEALQKSVDANKTSVAAAQQTANDALSKANANAADIAAVKTTAAEAGAKAASAAADAAEAKQKAQAALDAIGDVNIKTLAERVSALETKVAGLETLTEGLEQLKNDVASNKIAIADAKAKLESYSNWFNSVFAMVTSVELFGTYTGSAFCLNDLSKDGGKTPLLTMEHGNVLYTSVFGDNEALKNNLKDVFATATPQQSYTKGDDIKFASGLLLRINPANADLTNSKIMIVNSKGEAMDDYVEPIVSEATRYNKLITRGSTINTGLWSVPVQFKKGVDMDKFAAAIKDGSKSVLYAVAVNNTDTVSTYGGENRYVASTFDLTLASKNYDHATILNFTVDDNAIADIHNRWSGTEATTAGEGNTTTATSSDPKEYKWAESEKNYETPNSQIISSNDGSKKNVVVDASDNRSTQKLLNAKVGVPFTVEMTTKGVEYYYVVLDENFAIESTPSELNAWKTYSYTGLNTVVKATDKLQITVNNLNNVKGDVIGFRLFAVNYDGTLVDPDGRAFYVKVGDPETAKSVDAKIVALKAGSGDVIVALPEGLAACSKGLADTFNSHTGEAANKGFDEDSKTTTTDAVISYELLGEKKGATYESVSDWANAKFIKVTMNDVQNFQDNGKWTVVVNAADGTTLGDVKNVLTINVEKVMPTAAPDQLTWKTAQTVDGVYTCYVDPSKLVANAKAVNAKWNTATNNAYKNLAKAVNGLSDENYVFNIANAKKESQKYTKTLAVNGTDKDTYEMTIDAALVDSKTAHDVNVKYDYKNISYDLNKKGKLEKNNDYYVDALDGKIVFACAVADPVQTYSWLVRDIKDAEGNVTGHYSNNTVVYEETDKFGNDNVSGATLYWQIIAKNTYDSDFNLKDRKYFSTLYTEVVSAALVTAEGPNAGKEEYYDVTVNHATNAFTFKLKSNATNPTDDVKSNLVIVVKDAFGHENTITLPFIVKKK